MAQLYSKRVLALMCLYMEHAIKHDLVSQYQLDEVGPSDIASHLIQFTRLFAEDLVRGDSGVSSLLSDVPGCRSFHACMGAVRE